MNALELTGRSRTHIVQRDELRAAIHTQAVAAFVAMRDAAAHAGIELRVLSAFRDFNAQRAIWNRKFRGERPLHAADGSVLEHAALSEAQLIDAILEWSALPGTSRHHWGTDVDVCDAAAMPDGYRVQLLPAEYAQDGVFSRLSDWLERNMQRFDFFRPYDVYRGGVHPEPWHLSFAPVSTLALSLLTPEVIEEALRDAEILGRAAVLARLPQLYARYVRNVAAPQASPDPGTGSGNA
jgi:LAS superfamily LD-carboxypeptidase LdcB